MSPASNAYFVHASSHQVLRVHEHATHCCSEPNAMGIPENSLDHLDPVRDRIEVLEGVLALGWIRVRHRGPEATAEFLTEFEHTLEGFALCLDELQLGDSCWIIFYHLSTGECLGIHVSELKRKYEEGTIRGLLDRIEMK